MCLQNMNLRWMRCRKFKFILICFLLLLIIFMTEIDLSEETFNDKGTCPACFGSNLCSFMESGDIFLTGVSRWGNFWDVKNVFEGFWTTHNIPVVIKKLGYKSELDQLDSRLCAAAHQRPDCEAVTSIHILKETISRNFSMLQRIGKSFNMDWAECPSSEKVFCKYVCFMKILLFSTSFNGCSQGHYPILPNHKLPIYSPYCFIIRSLFWQWHSLLICLRQITMVDVVDWLCSLMAEKVWPPSFTLLGI